MVPGQKLSGAPPRLIERCLGVSAPSAARLNGAICIPSRTTPPASCCQGSIRRTVTSWVSQRAENSSLRRSSTATIFVTSTSRPRPAAGAWRSATNTREWCGWSSGGQISRARGSVNQRYTKLAVGPRCVGDLPSRVRAREFSTRVSCRSVVTPTHGSFPVTLVPRCSLSGSAGVGREAIGERDDEVAEFIGALDDERAVERGEYPRQPVELLRP